MSSHTHTSAEPRKRRPKTGVTARLRGLSVGEVVTLPTPAMLSPAHYQGLIRNQVKAIQRREGRYFRTSCRSGDVVVIRVEQHRGRRVVARTEQMKAVTGLAAGETYVWPWSGGVVDSGLHRAVTQYLSRTRTEGERYRTTSLTVGLRIVRVA